MISLRGIISDKLRANFTTEEILNNPRTKNSKPMPETGVKGRKLGKKPGRKLK